MRNLLRNGIIGLRRNWGKEVPESGVQCQNLQTWLPYNRVIFNNAISMAGHYAEIQSACLPNSTRSYNQSHSVFVTETNERISTFQSEFLHLYINNPTKLIPSFEDASSADT